MRLSAGEELTSSGIWTWGWELKALAGDFCESFLSVKRSLYSLKNMAVLWRPSGAKLMVAQQGLGIIYSATKDIKSRANACKTRVEQSAMASGNEKE
jgi:hypothetical protein